MASTAKDTLSTSAQATPAATGPGFRQTLGNALIITRREVRDSVRDWRILAPLIILTVFFPFLAQDVATRFSDFLSGFGAELIGERTIPFLLMIVGFFPISISLVIALETFVGEKERRSLEPLLSTPLTNTELYIGKTLSAMIPPLSASIIGMSVYLFILLQGQLEWRPQPMLVVQIIMLTIVQALVMVTGAVVVSSQTTSTRAANLLASFIIIPMTLLINGESVIMFLAPDAESPNGIGALWAIIVGMMVAAVLLLRVGNSIFNREELLGRTIDSINLKTTFIRIWSWVRAVDDETTPARNIVDWYRRAIPYSLKKLGLPLGVTIGVFVFVFVVGLYIGTLPQLQLPTADQTDSTMNINAMVDGFLGINGDGRLRLATMVFMQNSRVLLAAALLSLFSMGVGALVLTPFVFAIGGYVLSQMIIGGFDISLFFAAIVPHGIIEIPTIILATAAMLRLGAIVTRPPEGTTVGYAWTMALGDTVKIALGVIIPGLVISALLETFLTPAVISMVAG